MSDMEKTPADGENRSGLDSYGVWVKPQKAADAPSAGVGSDDSVKRDEIKVEDIDLSQVADENIGDGIEIVPIEESKRAEPKEKAMAQEGNGAGLGAGAAEDTGDGDVADGEAIPADSFEAVEDFMIATNDDVPDEDMKHDAAISDEADGGNKDATEEKLGKIADDASALGALPDGDVSLDDFMGDSGNSGDGEVSLDAFMGDGGGSSGGDGEVSLDDFMGGGDGDISLDDFMGEGFSAEQDKKDEAPDEPPLDIDLTFDAEPLETVEADDIGVDIEEITPDYDTEEESAADSGSGDMNLDDFADVGEMFDMGDNKGEEAHKAASIDSGATEEVDLSDFGIDADAEETAVTSNVSENKGKIAVVDYDLTVSMDDDVAAAPVVSEVPQGKGQVQNEVNGGNNAALMEATETIKQIAASLAGLQTEIDSIKREMADMKEHGVVSREVPVAELPREETAEAPAEALMSETAIADEAVVAGEMPVESVDVAEEVAPVAKGEETSESVTSAEEPAVVDTAGDAGVAPDVVESTELSAEEETEAGEGQMTAEDLSFDEMASAVEPPEVSSTSGFFSDDDGDDAIALSGDELTNMMNNAVIEETPAETVTRDSADAVTADSAVPVSETDNGGTNTADGIATAGDNAEGGVVGETVKEETGDNGELTFGAPAEEMAEGTSSGFFSDDEGDDAIALSGDELANMMNNAVIEEEPAGADATGGAAVEVGEEDTAASEGIEPKEASSEDGAETAATEGSASEEAVDGNVAAEEDETENEVVIGETVPSAEEEDKGKAPSIDDVTFEEHESEAEDDTPLEDFSADFEDVGEDKEKAAESNELPEEISVPAEENFEEPDASEIVEPVAEADEGELLEGATPQEVAEVQEGDDSETLSGEELSDVMSNAIINEGGTETSEDIPPLEDFSADFDGGNEEETAENESLPEEITVSADEGFEEPSVGEMSEPQEMPAEDNNYVADTEGADVENNAVAVPNVSTGLVAGVSEAAAEMNDEGETDAVPITSVDDIGGVSTEPTVADDKTSDMAESEIAEEAKLDTNVEAVPNQEDEEVAGEIGIAEEPLTEDDMNYLNSNAPIDETPPVMEESEPVLPTGEMIAEEMPNAVDGDMTASEPVEEATEGTTVEAPVEENTETAVVSPVADELAAEEIAPQASEEKGGVSLPSDLQGEVKAVLMYMDELLENLPEDKIAEFARSQQFVTYKKLFDELGLS